MTEMTIWNWEHFHFDDLPFNVAVFSKVFIEGLDASSGLEISEHDEWASEGEMCVN